MMFRGRPHRGVQDAKVWRTTAEDVTCLASFGSVTQILPLLSEFSLLFCYYYLFISLLSSPLLILFPSYLSPFQSFVTVVRTNL